jgi:UDP-N-acetylmuramate dehydrogenase
VTPRERIPLAAYTTLGVGGPARWFVEVGDAATLSRALAWARAHGVPMRVLGGGSNLVVADEGVDALVVRLALRGVEVREADGAVEVTAAAGESWDDFVRLTVERGWAGLECLSGIPGLVGATPMQNVGAYGQEVSDTITRVRALDTHRGEVADVPAAECGFAYRDSAFKRREPGRFVVLAVTYRLTPGGAPALRYADVERHLAARGVRTPRLGDVRESVIAIRRSKSMVIDAADPNRRSCGSFFTNPIIAREALGEVERRAGDSSMPRWGQSDGRVKLSAAWLIEHAGFQRGQREGPVGLSTRHALAIVAHDGARAADVLGFAARVQRTVQDRFGVRLKTPAARRLRIIRLVQARNAFGAVLTFLYFRIIDPLAADRGVTWGDIAFFVGALALLTLLGTLLGIRVNAPLMAPERYDPSRVRRAAIMFPYTMTAFAMLGWILAGVIFGVIEPWVHDALSVRGAARSLFGIIVIGGGVTAAFVFLSSERLWREELKSLFPDGDLGAVADVPRLRVRMRLLAAFTLTSVVPVLLVAVVAYRRTTLVAADPARAGALLTEMLVIVVFLVLVGLWAAIGLSLFVANSVAAPLSELEASMAKVERGNLDARAPVVSNDEIGGLAEGFNRMLAGLKERDFVKDTFGKYVTREIRDEILAGRVGLEGEQRDVTVLFADLRDFTPWVEVTEPREVVRDLNRYFGEMEAAVRAQGGLVLQFIGDEIEAVFGAPVPAADHARRAVSAALDMRARLDAFNAPRAAAGKPPLRHGIGVHTGTVLAGNIGSGERLSYALVGDTVNLASRIQDLTKTVGADILISGTTRAGLDGAVGVTPLPAARVKGRSAEVEVFAVVR